VLRVVSAEVEECVALLRKAHVFNEAAHAGVFSDVILRFFRRDWFRPAANHRCQKEDRERERLNDGNYERWLHERQAGTPKQMNQRLSSIL
jgi:hypothetical protein